MKSTESPGRRCSGGFHDEQVLVSFSSRWLRLLPGKSHSWPPGVKIRAGSKVAFGDREYLLLVVAYSK